jgi:hypothetical protein
MTREALRRRNGSLHDRIEEVLEMRDDIELTALNQDLHVEVGAPFLERTHDKLKERSSNAGRSLSIIFDDLDLGKGSVWR